MDNDIRRNKPVRSPQLPGSESMRTTAIPPLDLTQPGPTTTPQPQPIESTGMPPPVLTPTPVRKRKKWLLWVIITLIILTAGAALAGWFWYDQQLRPIDSGNTERIRVVIEPNSTPNAIAAQLKDANLIRSTEAFSLYTRISGTQNSLQAGAYRLSPSESTPEIVEHLTKGNVDTFDITFLPGATLADHRKVFLDAGYTEEEVDTALDATYSSPLFEGKPESADLEGYVYGETYRVGSGATVGAILEQTFAEFERVIEENDLKAGFAAQGKTLFQGIILASIIQRESIGGDEPQIAQVFYSRLDMGMQLGSDVTYQYIADKTGVERDVNLDSPYNTRRYTGLPPGPIASPGLNSLKAVANPAQGSYLYFLSGDDDVTYFATTLAEHEANIVEHCKLKCQIL